MGRWYWGLFWALLGAGIWLLIVQAAGNSLIVVDGAAPGGMMDHQAQPGDRAGAVQQAWAAQGMMSAAILLNRIDLVFIGVATVAGALGSVLIAAETRVLALRILAILALALWLAFGVTDYAETLAQHAQMHAPAGGPVPDGVSPLVKAIKGGAYLAGMVALIAALVWHSRGRAAAGV
jgi:hypothetical protein